MLVLNAVTSKRLFCGGRMLETIKRVGKTPSVPRARSVGPGSMFPHSTPTPSISRAHLARLTAGLGRVCNWWLPF